MTARTAKRHGRTRCLLALLTAAQSARSQTRRQGHDSSVTAHDFLDFLLRISETFQAESGKQLQSSQQSAANSQGHEAIATMMSGSGCSTFTGDAAEAHCKPSQTGE